jgi:hypothetical protein
MWSEYIVMHGAGGIESRSLYPLHQENPFSIIGFIDFCNSSRGGG